MFIILFYDPTRLKPANISSEPEDASLRRSAKPVICYPPESLPELNLQNLKNARENLEQVTEKYIPPREAECFEVEAGHFFRIYSHQGPQVGDLNLWSKANPEEKFYTGKTRALNGTHLSTGDRLWSCFPFLRPMACITHDSLDWYGFDEDGASVHDVIGTRCDPYTAKLLSGTDYHHCCHSNLIRAFSEAQGVSYDEAEPYVHDVFNVFMCTGFTQDTHQYFMKASPVRPGDYIEFFAEIDLLCGLSACPGGDCSEEHSSDQAQCYPLRVEILRPQKSFIEEWVPPNPSSYNRLHQDPDG